MVATDSGSAKPTSLFTPLVFGQERGGWEDLCSGLFWLYSGISPSRFLGLGVGLGIEPILEVCKANNYTISFERECPQALPHQPSKITSFLPADPLSTGVTAEREVCRPLPVTACVDRAFVGFSSKVLEQCLAQGSCHVSS